MTPTEFLTTIWPAQGPYCLATPFKNRDGKYSYRHKVVGTISEARSFVAANKNDRNIFFAVHALKEAKVWNPEKYNYQTQELGAFETRTQSNMRECKVFYADLDVGELEGKYDTQRNALADLIRFCQTTGFPKPLITSSGGGLHVYWLLTDTLPSDEWRTEALKLKRLFKHHGLKADPARTADSASVLRVAGTYNLKDLTNPRPVKVLMEGKPTPTGEFLKLLKDSVIKAGIEIKDAPPSTPAGAFAGLGSNTDMGNQGPPTSMAAVLKVCAQMRRQAELKGNVTEPEWYHTLQLVAHLQNPEKLAHKISAGYKGYDPAEVDRKLAQLKHKGTGPTKCSTFAAVSGTNLCEGCVFRHKDSSPIVAARYQDPAPAPVVNHMLGQSVVSQVVPDPPKPYIRMKTGQISVHETNKDGDEIDRIIYDHDLYPIRRLTNVVAETEQSLWRVVLPSGDRTTTYEKDFSVDAPSLYDLRKLAGDLSNAGIYFHPANLKDLQEYMTAYIRELQRLAAAEKQATHLGWIDEQTSFVLPDRILLPNGTAKPVSLSLNAERASSAVKKKGTLDRQVELLRFYKHPAYVQHQFLILCGLAAPTFYATGQYGMVVNASGPAGASKSSALYTAAGLWGDPVLYTINGTNSGDTARARNERVTTLANLPICVDEITNLPSQEAINLAMGSTQPGNRGRLQNDGTLKPVPETFRSNFLLTTANNSLHGLLSQDHAASTAGSMRVFEMAFRPLKIHQKFEADDYLREMKENYGHIGEVFMSWIVQNKEAHEARIREIMKELDAATNVASSERFWSACPAAAIAAGEVANRLNLLSFDLDYIRQWFINVQMPFMRGSVNDEYASPVAMLTDYLEHINGEIIVVQKLQNHSNTISNILKLPRGQLLGHYDLDSKSLWVLKKAFKDYCSRMGASASGVLDELSRPVPDANGQLNRIISNRQVRKILGAGTDLAKAQSWCFQINMAHPELTGAVNNITTKAKATI